MYNHSLLCVIAKAEKGEWSGSLLEDGIDYIHCVRSNHHIGVIINDSGSDDDIW
jgi:hypothetical protein